jgi:hypothetical protein
VEFGNRRQSLVLVKDRHRLHHARLQQRKCHFTGPVKNSGAQQNACQNSVQDALERRKRGGWNVSQNRRKKDFACWTGCIHDSYGCVSYPQISIFGPHLGSQILHKPQFCGCILLFFVPSMSNYQQDPAVKLSPAKPPTPKPKTSVPSAAETKAERAQSSPKNRSSKMQSLWLRLLLSPLNNGRRLNICRPCLLVCLTHCFHSYSRKPHFRSGGLFAENRIYGSSGATGFQDHGILGFRNIPIMKHARVLILVHYRHPLRPRRFRRTKLHLAGQKLHAGLPPRLFGRRRRQRQDRVAT